MIKAVQFLVLSAAFSALNAHAQEDLPESCRPKVGNTELPLAEQADAAQLQCDIDRAAILADRSETIHDADNDPVLRIVDTLAPSGAAYIYDIMDADSALMLDVRTVPSDMSDDGIVPVCRLQMDLPADVSLTVEQILQTASSEDIPAYGPRERMVINPDGSRSFELLLDPHDIITSIQTIDGLRQFSRHADATDDIANLNTGIIGVANFSDGWVCNLNTN